MDISARWCRRISRCIYCPEPIVKGDKCFRLKFWLKADGEAKRHPKTYYTHIVCYVRQAVDYLNNHPPVRVHVVGRPKLEVKLKDPEAARKRRLIVRHYAVLKFRYAEQERRFGFTADAARLAELSLRMSQLKAEIETLGGVPKKWL